MPLDGVLSMPLGRIRSQTASILDVARVARQQVRVCV
jgi:hypothetical protein